MVQFQLIQQHFQAIYRFLIINYNNPNFRSRLLSDNANLLSAKDFRYFRHIPLPI